MHQRSHLRFIVSFQNSLAQVLVADLAFVLQIWPLDSENHQTLFDVLFVQINLAEER